MTIRTKLTLNVVILIVIIAVVATTSFIGMSFIKQKLSYLTERSTPFQMRTVEFQRAVQGATSDLVKVSASINIAEYKSFCAEAEKSLAEVKRSSVELEKLTGGDKMASVDELIKSAEEIIRVTDGRLKAEEVSGAMSRTVDKQLAGSAAQLASLDGNIRKLQSSRALAYLSSLDETKKSTGKVRSVELLRILIKDVQLAVSDIQKATGKSGLLIAKGKATAGIAKAMQNDYLKESKTLGPDIKALGEKVDELIKAQSAHLSAGAQAGGASDRSTVDSVAKECVDRLATIMMTIEQEIVINSERNAQETTRQGDIFDQSSVATTILAGNSELVNLGSTIDGLTSRLFIVTNEQELKGIEEQIARAYQRIGAIKPKLEAALKKVRAGREVTILNGAIASLASVHSLLVANDGVVAAVRNKLLMEKQAQGTMAKLREIVVSQAEKGKKAVTVAQGDQEKAIATVNSMVRSTISLIVGISIGAIVFGVLFGAWIYRSIARPLQRLLVASEEVAHGNLGNSVTSDSNDEVGQVQQSVGKMVEALRSVIGKIHLATDNLASSSEELSATANALERGSEEQTRRVEQSTTAMEEMTQTTGEVARNSSETSNAADRMRKIAEEGKETMQRSVGELEIFAETVKEAAGKVEILGTQSEEISNVVTLIKDIADQTNLLALNAAIEAARAGDMGRGFAVVADEVRQLAEKTTTATNEISQTIHTMQGSVGDSVRFMKSEREAVDRVMVEISATLNAINEIVVCVGQVSDMVQRIAVAAEEQSSTSEHITQNMHGIAQITHELRSSFEDIKNSATGLSALATELSSTVSWFKSI